MRLAHGRGVKALRTTDVERLGRAAQHHREDPRAARQPACLADADRAGGRPRDADAGQQVCWSRVTIRVVASRRAAASARGAVRGRPQHVAQPTSIRPPITHLPVRAGSAGRRERVQVGQQQVGHGVGDPAPEVGGAVTPAARGQPRVPRGGSLLALQRLTLVVVGDLGGDHVEDPAAEDPQLPRTEPCSLGHEALLRHALGRQRRRRRQLVQRPRDHLRLPGVDGAFTQPRGHPLPPVVQRLGQAQVAPALTSVQPRRVAQPRRLVAGTVRLGDVGGRGRTRSRSSASRPASSVSSSNASRLSSVRMKPGSTSATSFNAASIAAAHPSTGWEGGDGP